MPTVVEKWFDTSFAQLHPLLQALHRQGGSLSGPVEIAFGRGPGGFIGRRIARGLGIPTDRGSHSLHVSIRSTGDTLHWDRQFDGQRWFRSTFTAVGQFPAGHWEERSGAVRLRLRVSIVDGAWHWQHTGSWLGPLPLPRALLPRTTARKEIVAGKYRFLVAIGLPLVGTVLQYSGDLEPATASCHAPELS